MAEDEDKQGKSNGEQQQDELPSDVDELKRMLAEERRKLGQVTNDRAKATKARDELSKRMKTWMELEEEGHSPDEIKAVLDKQTSAEVQKARDSGDLDKMIANATKAAKRQAEEERAKREKAEGLVQRVLVDDRLNTILAKYVDPRYHKAVFSMLRSKVQAVEDSEDDYGMRPAVLVGDEYIPAEEWVRKWAETDEESTPFLKPSLAGGGGAGGGAGAKVGMKARLDMTPMEKSQFIRQKGLAAYNALPLKRTA